MERKIKRGEFIRSLSRSSEEGDKKQRKWTAAVLIDISGG
jgi:hypothetical protein